MEIEIDNAKKANDFNKIYNQFKDEYYNIFYIKISIFRDNLNLNDISFKFYELSIIGSMQSNNNYLLNLQDMLKKLTIENCRLTSLPTLPTNLQILNCTHNRLRTLPKLPASLQKLICDWNHLTSLPELPENLQILHCENNQLTSLPKLPESLKALYCEKNQLTSLPKLPESLQTIWCYDNQLTSLPELPKILQEFWNFTGSFTPIFGFKTERIEENKRLYRLLRIGIKIMNCLISFQKLYRERIWHPEHEYTIKKNMELFEGYGVQTKKIKL